MRRYTKGIIVLLVVLVAGGLLIGFESAENKSKVCNKVIVTLDNQVENHFLDEHDIMRLITAQGTEVIEGIPFSQLNLRQLENRLNDEPFLKDAEIYVDHSGNMMVHAELRRPMARIVRYNGPDAYVGEDGQILPVSDKFTRRTIVIYGNKAKDISEQENIRTGDYAPLYALVNKIRSDKFWSAQIAQIKVLKSGEVILYPQVTKQYIEFGKIEDVDIKFKKLKLFYEDILPRKGWNYYSRVSLKYKNQIICE